METSKISVIIPFYNAKEFVTQAVESALMQPETGEVLLIEDGSPDGGLEICQSLAKQYAKVKLLRHHDGRNCGASASRNLGIKTAKYPLIAFLDADDYYLLDRFKMTMEVFQEHRDAEGVYEAIGATYQNDTVKEFFLSLNFKEITTIEEIVPPEKLFAKLIGETIGYFHLNGFTARKDIFRKSGLFNEGINFGEDTDLMYRMCAIGKLYPGCIKTPVALRRVHDLNRITYHLAEEHEAHQMKLFLLKNLYVWSKRNLSIDQQKIILYRIIFQLRMSDRYEKFRWSDYFFSRGSMLKLVFNEPSLLLDQFFWRKIMPSRDLVSKA